jgi:hypothetical protein
LGIDGRAVEVGGNTALPDTFSDRITFGAQFAIGVVIEERCAMRIR